LLFSSPRCTVHHIHRTHSMSSQLFPPLLFKKKISKTHNIIVNSPAGCGVADDGGTHLGRRRAPVGAAWPALHAWAWCVQDPSIQRHPARHAGHPSRQGPSYTTALASSFSSSVCHLFDARRSQSLSLSLSLSPSLEFKEFFNESAQFTFLLSFSLPFHRFFFFYFAFLSEVSRA